MMCPAFRLMIAAAVVSLCMCDDRSKEIDDELAATEALIRLYEKKRELLAAKRATGTISTGAPAQAAAEELLQAVITDDAEVRINEEPPQSALKQASEADAPVRPSSQVPNGEPSERSAEDLHDSFILHDSVALKSSIYPLVSVFPLHWRDNSTGMKLLAKEGTGVVPDVAVMYLRSDGSFEIIEDFGSLKHTEIVVEGNRINNLCVAMGAAPCTVIGAAHILATEPHILIATNLAVYWYTATLYISNHQISSNSYATHAADESGNSLLHLKEFYPGGVIYRADRAGISSAALFSKAGSGIPLCFLGLANGEALLIDQRAHVNLQLPAKRVAPMMYLAKSGNTLAVAAGELIHFISLSSMELLEATCHIPLEAAGQDQVSQNRVASAAFHSSSALWYATTNGDIYVTRIVFRSTGGRKAGCSLVKRFTHLRSPPSGCVSISEYASVCDHVPLIAALRGGHYMAVIAGKQVIIFNATAEPAYSGKRLLGGLHQGSVAHEPLSQTLLLPSASLCDALPAEFGRHGSKRRREKIGLVSPPSAQESKDAMFMITGATTSLLFENLLPQQSAVDHSGFLETITSARLPVVVLGIIIAIALHLKRQDGRPSGVFGNVSSALTAFGRGPFATAARVAASHESRGQATQHGTLDALMEDLVRSAQAETGSSQQRKLTNLYRRFERTQHGARSNPAVFGDSSSEEGSPPDEGDTTTSRAELREPRLFERFSSGAHATVNGVSRWASALEGMSSFQQQDQLASMRAAMDSPNLEGMSDDDSLDVHGPDYRVVDPDRFEDDD